MIRNVYIHAILIFIVAMACLRHYSYRKLLPTKVNLEPSADYDLLTPFSQIEGNQFNISYTRLIDLEDFEFKLHPNACSDQPFLLIITVPSAVLNFDNRQTIRSSWGKPRDAVKTVFIVGFDEDAMVNDDLVQESRNYGDIVQGNVLDTWRNLTYKTLMGLKWVVHHCPTARYVVKTDDDVFINYFALIKFLSKDLSPWGALLYLGGVVSWIGADPVRNNMSKYYLPKEMFAGEILPTYCTGEFVLYSNDILPYLLEQSQDIPYIHIEDLYVTGFLPEKTGITHKDLSGFKLSFENMTSFLKNGFTEFRCRFIFGPHDLTPSEILDLWKKVVEEHDHRTEDHTNFSCTISGQTQKTGFQFQIAAAGI